MSLKHTTLLLSFFLFTSILFAQSDVTLKLTKDREVYLNTTKLDTSTTIEDINTILGEPTIYKEYKYTGKINYHYESQGISVHTVKGKLLLIGANLNWDGDKTFPETSYEGALEMDGVQINKASNETVLKEITSVDFLCPMPGLCLSKDEAGKVLIVIGFKDEKVTQVGFEFQ